MQPGEIERYAPGWGCRAWSTTLEDQPAARPLRPRPRRGSAPVDASPTPAAAANPVPTRALSRSRSSAPPPDVSDAPSGATAPRGRTTAPRSRTTARRLVVSPDVVADRDASTPTADGDVVHHEVVAVHGEASIDALPPTGPVPAVGVYGSRRSRSGSRAVSFWPIAATGIRTARWPTMADWRRRSTSRSRGFWPT